MVQFLKNKGQFKTRPASTNSVPVSTSKPQTQRSASANSQPFTTYNNRPKPVEQQPQASATPVENQKDLLAAKFGKGYTKSRPLGPSYTMSF